MDWLWPGFLFLLGLIPLILMIYIWNLRRRRRFAVRYSSLVLVRQALPQYSNLRRHLPFALFLLALASLVIALARPAAVVLVPTDKTTIILAMDVSRSMCSADIAPNRLVAAQKAAISFIERQKSSTQIGIVAFAGFAELVQPPTMDQEALREAIERLYTGRRTAIGSGILRSLDAIAEVDEGVAPGTSQDGSAISPTPVPPGMYAPDIIVLLTDGASNTGPLPLEAAQQAADRGIRVYTIGFGTENGGTMGSCGRQYQEFDYFGGSTFGGGFRRGIDEGTLIEVAAMTGGEYYSASSANELENVFKKLPTYLITRRETIEISVVFAALGALLTALAVGLSLAWNALP
jgi:Ca-activated chloride channel homolog